MKKYKKQRFRIKEELKKKASVGINNTVNKR